MSKGALLAGVVGLLAVMIFIKAEMARNRRILSKELSEHVELAPEKFVKGSVEAIGKALSSELSTNVLQRNGTQDVIDSLFQLGTQTAHELDKAASKATELSEDEEIAFGEKLHKEILRSMPTASAPQTLARLEKLAQPLVDQRARKRIAYHFFIVQSEIVNAFSIAGGYVYVTTNYLKNFSSDPELAMTLGHEIAHIDLKHAVHKVQYEYHGEKLFGELASLAQIPYAILSSPYTKEQEYEADAWGFKACKKAGWDSNKILALYQNFEKVELTKRDLSSLPSEWEKRLGNYFDSHPKTEDRLARLKEL